MRLNIQKTASMIIIVILLLWLTPTTFAIYSSYGVDLGNEAYSQEGGNPYKKPQCTWYVWGRAKEKLGISLPTWYHAKYWTGQAEETGAFRTGTTARANSIMVEDWGDPVGHVFFVEDVSDGCAYVTESNRLVNGDYVDYNEDVIYLDTMRRESDPNTQMGDVTYIYLTQEGADLGDQFFAYIRHQNKQVYLTQESNAIYGRAFTGNNDQIWAFYRQANGAYAIVNVNNNGCIDVLGASTEGGATVYTYTGGYSGLPNQEFYINYMYGAYYFSPAHSNGNNMLDMSETTYKLELWGRGEDWSPQEFDIFIIPSINGRYPADVGTDFYGYIRHINTNYYLSNQKDNIAGEPFTGEPEQTWYFRRMPNGSYVIENAYNGSCIDVLGASTTGGGNVYAFNGGYVDLPNQRFFIYRMFNGYYFSPEHSKGLNMLDMSESTYNLEIWGVPGEEWPPQQFMIEPVQNHISITYDANGGTNPPSQQTKTKGTDLTLSSDIPTREDVFDGGCTITFDANGGTVSPASMTQTFTRKFSFRNWNTAADGSGTDYSAGSVYSRDESVTLYAQWDSTLHANSILLPEPTRNGYTALGWSEDENATTAGYQIGASYSTDNSTTLYAVWEPVRYTITFDANGGVNPPAAVSYEGAAGRIPTEIPSRPHHTFKEWSGNRNGAVVSFAPGDTYDLFEDITLYAVWEQKFDHVLSLPRMLAAIEDEAFIGTDADAIFVPDSVTRIAENAFDNGVAIYGGSGTAAEIYANQNGLTFIPVTDDWVLEDAVPQGAHVTQDKWTYTLTTTETTTSTATTLDGWTQVGFEWEQTGTGTHTYANFPEGFDTGHSLYNTYAKSALNSSLMDTTKREVSGNAVKDYIYWHWTWYWGTSENKLINDHYCIEDGREYSNFKAYENGYIEYVSGNNYVNWDRGGEEDGSCWWFRFDVLQQTYTDYRKVFTYMKSEEETLDSAVPVVEDGNISNVRHWVKYEF